jgi:hypothetical protein
MILIGADTKLWNGIVTIHVHRIGGIDRLPAARKWRDGVKPLSGGRSSAR